MLANLSSFVVSGFHGLEIQYFPILLHFSQEWNKYFRNTIVVFFSAFIWNKKSLLWTSGLILTAGGLALQEAASSNHSDKLLQCYGDEIPLKLCSFILVAMTPVTSAACESERYMGKVVLWDLSPWNRLIHKFLTLLVLVLVLISTLSSYNCLFQMCGIVKLLIMIHLFIVILSQTILG